MVTARLLSSRRPFGSNGRDQNTAEPPLSGPVLHRRLAASAATIGIFFLLFGTFLYVARTLVAPVVSAAIVSTMFGPLSAQAARYRMPPTLFALACTGFVVAALNVAMVLLGAAVSDWAAKGPEIAAALKVKAQVLERPLEALRESYHAVGALLGVSAPLRFDISASNLIAPVVTFLTPALGELLLFFVSLFFFLLGRNSQRRFLVTMLQGQDARLRALRMLNEIEHNLTRFLGTVTVVNCCVGLATAAIVYVLGLPTPLLWGMVAFLLNFIPYVGPAIVTAILFLVGIIASPTLVQSLIAPAAFIVLATVEGHLLTPSIIGRRLALNPLLTFLSVAFWTWLWGPLGAFLAIPLLITIVGVSGYTLRTDLKKLPG